MSALEWNLVSLDDCVAPNAPICYGILMPGQHVSGGVPVVKVRDIEDGVINESDLLLTDPSIDAAYKRSRLAMNDVLITIRGTTGRIARTPQSLHGANITQDTARIRVLANVSSDFVYHALQSEAVQQQIALHTIGQAVRGINIADVRRLVFNVPKEPDEQRAVAEALSDVDAMLTGLDQLIAKKRDLKQAAMQQLLSGHIRLPGFRETWQHVTLGDLFTFKNGLSKAKQFFGYGTPIVNYMDVFSSPRVICSDLAGRVSLTKQELSTFDVKSGDVLFTRTSETPEEIGMSAVVLDEPEDAVFSGFLLRGRPINDRLCNEFKVYCFRSAFVRAQIISKASYTTRALTNGKILSAVMLPVPPIAEQQAIAETLSDMDSEIATLGSRRAKTLALKQAMMQELLTGRIRLV